MPKFDAARTPSLAAYLHTQGTEAAYQTKTFRSPYARQLAAAMSDAYERERQNNSRLDELSAKVSALRGVTIDIYDNARDQGVIDSTVQLPTPLPAVYSV